MNNKVFKNASWIIALQITRMLIGLVISMLTARYLGPSNFGVINYAASLVAFITPIMYLGLNGILVHELFKYPNKQGEVLGTSIGMSFISAIFCIVGITSFAFIANANEKETIIVTALYSLMLIFQSVDIITYWFQAKLLSKYHSIISIISYLVVSAYKIFLLVTGKSVYWFAVSHALDYMILSFLAIVVYKRKSKDTLKFSFSMAKILLSKSKYYILSNMMITIFAQTDKVMLKLIKGNEVMGYYSAAVTCMGVTGFLFSAIIDSFRPVIFENKNNDEQRYRNSLIKLYNIITYLALIQAVLMTLFSDLIIKILYGQAYIEASIILQVMIWSVLFSLIGGVRDIWILAEHKQKYLWIINLSGAIINVILNFVFIPIMGGVGAATASIITQLFTNVIMCYIIKPIGENNKILFASLSPKLFYNTLKDIILQILNKKKSSKAN